MPDSTDRRMEEMVSAWRYRVARTSPLSAHELEELEDHLRARALLEMELDAGLTPRRAVQLAEEGLGDSRTLAREFINAGRPRWRALMVVGWGLWAVAWALPASTWRGSAHTMAGMLAGDVVLATQGSVTSLLGLLMLTLLNVPMVLTLLRYRSARRIGRLRMATWLLTANAIGVLVIGGGFVARWWSAGAPLSTIPVGSGWWVYTASLASVATAMWMRVSDFGPLWRRRSRKEA